MSDQQWDRRKRTLTWVHQGIQLVVLLALLVVVNLLAQKFPKRWDLTSRRTYALSVMAEDLLRDMKYDVEIWVNPSFIGAGDDKALPNGLRITREMLEEFAGQSGGKLNLRVFDKFVERQEYVALALRFMRFWQT